MKKILVSEKTPCADCAQVRCWTINKQNTGSNPGAYNVFFSSEHIECTPSFHGKTSERSLTAEVDSYRLILIVFES